MGQGHIGLGQFQGRDLARLNPLGHGTANLAGKFKGDGGQLHAVLGGHHPNPCLLGGQDDIQPLGLKVPMGLAAFQLGHPHPLGALAPQLDELRQSQFGYGRIIPLPRLGASELIGLQLGFRVGQKPRLQNRPLACA